MQRFHATADNEHAAAILALFGATATTSYVSERDTSGYPVVVWYATDRGLVRTETNGDGLDGSLTLWDDVRDATITGRRWAARSGELTLTLAHPALTLKTDKEEPLDFARDVIGRLGR